MPQHAAADAAVRLHADPGEPGPAQVQRQRVRLDRGTGRRVDQQRRVVAGRQAQLGPARAQPLQLGPTAAGRRASARPARAGAAPAASSGRQTRSVPASTALRRKSARSSSQLARRPRRRTTPTKPAWAATPPLIASEAKWSSSTTSARRTPGTADHRVVRVRDHEEGEVRARRSTSAAAAGRSRISLRRDTCTTATKPSEVTGSSSSGSRTVSSAARRARVAQCAGR